MKRKFCGHVWVSALLLVFMRMEWAKPWISRVRGRDSNLLSSKYKSECLRQLVRFFRILDYVVSGKLNQDETMHLFVCNRNLTWCSRRNKLINHIYNVPVIWLWLFSNCLSLIVVPFSFCRWVSNCWRHLARCLQHLCFWKLCKYLSLKKTGSSLLRVYFSLLPAFISPVCHVSLFICLFLFGTKSQPS
jgi:hypothetical protein